MDVLLAEPIVRALTDAVRRCDTGYPVGTEYAEAFKEFAARRWGWNDVAVERTAIVPDVMMGIVEILHLVTKPGSAVVVNCPVYPPFYAFVEKMNRRIIEAPLGADSRLDLDTLAEAFGEATYSGKPAAYLLCSPHNPTGTVHTLDELTSVAQLANEHGIRVVADEIHGPLVLRGARFVPYLTVPNGENAFSLVSASKAWNLAGLRAALAVAGSAAAIDLDRLPEVVSHGPSHLGVIAHSAALRDGGPWLDALLAGLDGNRHLLATLLKLHLPLVRHIPPEATYLAWLDCRKVDVERGVSVPQKRGLVARSAGPADTFLDRARVALSAGQAFGSGGTGHVRLNFATSRGILSEAIQRMSDSVNGPDS